MLQVVKCYFRCAKTEVEMGVGNVMVMMEKMMWKKEEVMQTVTSVVM